MKESSTLLISKYILSVILLMKLIYGILLLGLSCAIALIIIIVTSSISLLFSIAHGQFQTEYWGNQTYQVLNNETATETENTTAENKAAGERFVNKICERLQEHEDNEFIAEILEGEACESGE